MVEVDLTVVVVVVNFEAALFGAVSCTGTGRISLAVEVDLTAVGGGIALTATVLWLVAFVVAVAVKMDVMEAFETALTFEHFAAGCEGLVLAFDKACPNGLLEPTDVVKDFRRPGAP